MRHSVLWALVLLVLPGVAAAEGVRTDAVAEALHDAVPGATSDASSALDLSIDPTLLPGDGMWGGASPIEGAPVQRYTDSASGDDERGLSFGLEVKPRRATDGLARNAETDQPGLEDNVERLIEHSTLGLRGTYRF